MGLVRLLLLHQEYSQLQEHSSRLASGHMVERECSGLLSSSYKAANPIMGTPRLHLTFIIFQRLHLQTPSHWGFRALTWEFGRAYRHSVHNGVFASLFLCLNFPICAMGGQERNWTEYLQRIFVCSKILPFCPALSGKA